MPFRFCLTGSKKFENLISECESEDSLWIEPWEVYLRQDYELLRHYDGTNSQCNSYFAEKDVIYFEVALSITNVCYNVTKLG